LATSEDILLAIREDLELAAREDFSWPRTGIQAELRWNLFGSANAGRYLHTQLFKCRCPTGRLWLSPRSKEAKAN
jgi:hypothetical protein